MLLTSHLTGRSPVHAGDPLAVVARDVLALLHAAGTWLDDAELIRELGCDAARALDALHNRLLVERDGARSRERAGAGAAIYAEAAFDRLARISARMLAGRPGDPRVLVLACLAHARDADGAGALRTLIEHPAARSLVHAAELARVVRAIATAEPALAAEAHVLFARELIRRGDFDSARRTLDDLDATGLALRHVRVLRAQALVRAGALAAAEHELRTGGLADDLDVAILQAGIDGLRGDLRGARTRLLALRIRDAHEPRLGGLRATAVALTYLFEERYALALAWARRARRAFVRRSPVPVISLVNAIEVMALLGLDRPDHAASFVAREASARRAELLEDPDVRGFGAMLRASLQGRRGDVRTALELGDRGLRTLDERGDHVARAVALRLLGWAAIAYGDLERAEHYLRECDGIATAAELGGLLATCELERARLARARGRTSEIAPRLAAARALTPRSPFVQIEHWATTGEPGPAPCTAVEGVAGYAALRSAERALDEGRLDDARADAGVAEAWYAEAGAAYERARALVCRAEADTRAGEHAAAARALAACDELATAGGHRGTLVASALVAAHAGDRGGDLGAYVAALARARAHAGAELWDAALEAACRRAGLAPAPARLANGAPWASLVARLGLARGCATLGVDGARACLLDRGEPYPHAVDIVLDLEGARAIAQRHARPLRGQNLRLLAALIEAGAGGLSAERMYLELWGARVYHALRHRSTVYMAISRLRQALGDRGRDPLIEQLEGGYRIGASRRAAILYPVLPTGECRDAAAVALWETALRRAT